MQFFCNYSIPVNFGAGADKIGRLCNSAGCCKYKQYEQNKSLL